jgi:hypothetical protein
MGMYKQKAKNIVGPACPPGRAPRPEVPRNAGFEPDRAASARAARRANVVLGVAFGTRGRRRHARHAALAAARLDQAQ